MFLWAGYKLKRVLSLQYVVNGYLWYWLLYFPRELNWSTPPWPRHFGLAIPNQVYVCRHMSHFRKLWSVWITPKIGQIRAERRQPIAHQGRKNHRDLIYVRRDGSPRLNHLILWNFSGSSIYLCDWLYDCMMYLLIANRQNPIKGEVSIKYA